MSSLQASWQRLNASPSSFLTFVQVFIELCTSKDGDHFLLASCTSLVNSLKEAYSLEVGTSHICFIISCPSTPLVCSMLSKCSLGGWMGNKKVSSLRCWPCITSFPTMGWSWTLSDATHLAFLAVFQPSYIPLTHSLGDREEVVPGRSCSSLPSMQYAQGPLTFSSSAICLFSPKLKIPTNVTRLHSSLLTCHRRCNTNEHLRCPWIGRRCRALRR
jgi:hypothetical protein